MYPYWKLIHNLHECVLQCKNSTLHDFQVTPLAIWQGDLQISIDIPWVWPPSGNRSKWRFLGIPFNLKHVIIPVVTVTGRGPHPRYPIYPYFLHIPFHFTYIAILPTMSNPRCIIDSQPRLLSKSMEDLSIEAIDKLLQAQWCGLAHGRYSCLTDCSRVTSPHHVMEVIGNFSKGFMSFSWATFWMCVCFRRCVWCWGHIEVCWASMWIY